MIPEQRIQEVKEKADLIELFRFYGLQLGKRGDDFFTSCPFHEDTTPSLSVNPVKGVFHCFSCGEKGNAIQFFQKMEGLEFPEAVDKLARWAGLPAATAAGGRGQAGNGRSTTSSSPPRRGSDGVVKTLSPEERTGLLANVFKRFQSHFTQSSAAPGYLVEKRGLAHVNEIEVGFCPRNFAVKLDKSLKEQLTAAGLLHSDGRPHFTDCVVFPLRNLAGDITGFYGRRIKGTGAAGRHYYLPGEREGVFSIHDGSEEVHITESVIDALSLNHSGITSVLALHGVNGFTKIHEQWLSAKGIKTVYLVLDGDKAGREASAKLSERLNEKGYKFHVIELPDGMDPNSFLLAAKGMSDLKALPGYPKPANADHGLTRQGEELIFTTQERTYTIKGLVAQGLDRLRVTLKCTSTTNPNYFHIDQLDLYAARPRASFIEGVVKEMAADHDKVTDEVKALITGLEKERLLGESGASLKPVMDEEEKNQALSLLKSKDLFKILLSDFERCGVVGDPKLKLLATIGSVSRLLPKPLGVLIVSRSGSGKTTLQNAVCDFVPAEDLLQLTRLTGQALFYKGEDGLKNKVLAIEEEEGMEQALYSIRTLQSSQRLSTATTRTDPKTGRLTTDEFTVRGPVSIFISSTNPNTMDSETRSRFLIGTIDETKEQTLRIFKWGDRVFSGEAYEEEKEAVKRKWQNAQRLLRPLKVVDDIMPLMDYPVELLQHRREREKYRSLLHTIALFRQYQKRVHKEVKGGNVYESISVDVEDVALANELALEFLPNSLDDMAPHTRRLGEVISCLCEEKAEPTFTRKDLREYSGWTDWSCRQGLEQLLELEYIAKLTGGNGVTFQYRLLVDVRKESRRNLSLTSVEDLKKRMAKRKKGKNGASGR